MSQLMEKSINLAKRLTFHQNTFRVAAFIYSGRKLLAIGQNNMISTNAKIYRLAQRFNVDHFKDFAFGHAELTAISKLWGKYYISGKETLVVVRLNKKGNPVLAKPCKNCQIVLDSLGLTKVYWTQNEISK